MGITYFNDKVQVSHSLTGKKCQEIDKHFFENKEKVFRLYWFEGNNDFTFLKNIKNVKKLEISYSKIDDFNFLKYTPEVEYLDINEIDGNPSILTIGELYSLKILNLNLRKSTKQMDLNCLKNLKNIEKLYFHGKFKKNSLQIDFSKLVLFAPQMDCINLSEIKNFSKLNTLQLLNQKIVTLNGIENMIHLQNILINSIKIDDQKILSPIFTLKELENLSIFYVKTIIDFTFIQENKTIKNLYLWSLNGLKTLNGIENLKSLEKYIQNGEHSNKNTIDYSGLLKLKKLKEVEIKIGKMNKEAEEKLNGIIEKIK
jgi:internalin A